MEACNTWRTDAVLFIIIDTLISKLSPRPTLWGLDFSEHQQVISPTWDSQFHPATAATPYWTARIHSVNLHRIRKPAPAVRTFPDRKSTRLNSSHVKISYAVFC